MIGEGVKSQFTGIPGWSTEAESTALVELARKYVPEKDGVIVELGVEYAKSTSDFAYATKDKLDTRIVSVDLFPDDHHIAGHHGGLLAVWRANLAESGVTSYPAYIIPARGVSWDVGNEWQEPIDLLFIDAGHHYDEVNRDISAWLHHVKPGGVVVFHDYAKDENAHPLHYEVKRAVDGYFDNPSIIEGYWTRIDLPDTLIAFKNNFKGDKAVNHETSTALEGEPKATQKKAPKAKTTKGATSGKRTGKRTTK